MMQVIQMTDREKLKMYMKCSKKELAKMLMECNKQLAQVNPTVSIVEIKEAQHRRGNPMTGL